MLDFYIIFDENLYINLEVLVRLTCPDLPKGSGRKTEHYLAVCG
jgi:hypothetical protein